MIKLKGVSKFYKTKTGVSEGMRDVSVNFSLNEFVAITGESGSGKTTLLNVISGLDSYEDGELYINDKETSHYTVKEWEEFRASNVGFIFQNYNVIDSYSVYQNVLIALEAQGYDESDKKQRALDLIKQVGLYSHKDQKTSKLSGGQKQRVVIARALAKNAPIILADEPTGNLDASSGVEIMELLKEISKDKLVLLVTHNYEEAKPYITRKITMRDATIKDDEVIVETSKETKLINKTNDNKQIESVKTSSKIAFRNIFATPKRTIFSLALSIVAISIFLLFYSALIKEASLNITGPVGAVNKAYVQIRQEETKFDKDSAALVKLKLDNNNIKVYPNLPDLYTEVEGIGYMPMIDQVGIVDIKDLTAESRLPLNSKEVIMYDYYNFEDYKIGDNITLNLLSGIKHEVTIVGLYKNDTGGNYHSSLTIFFNDDFLYDTDTYTLNPDVYYHTTDKSIYELTIEAKDRQEILLLKDKIISMDEYRFIDPYLRYENELGFVTGTIKLFFWMILIGILSIVFLVTFNVQKNMMESRLKDFSVYRSIGISEKEVGITILIEQIIIAVIALITTITALYLLSIPSDYIRKLTRHLGLKDFLLVSLIFGAFSIYQGLKFNKRVFNITVIESLREAN